MVTAVQRRRRRYGDVGAASLWGDPTAAPPRWRRPEGGGGRAMADPKRRGHGAGAAAEAAITAK
jgi:hypothetical protein